MWKPKQSDLPEIPARPEPAVQATPISSYGSSHRPSLAPAAASEGVIGKNLRVVGEVTGNDSLLIEGSVEGSVHLTSARVTVGAKGTVQAGETLGERCCVTAGEIVILGKISGNICATDRVDIRPQGTLTGDITTARIAIADGANFRGGIEVRKSE
jgi:cytoskeletal protein CcmA (bactofilin family)